MAARIEAAPKVPSPELVDLRQLRAEDLDPLLNEEIRNWQNGLAWDFSKSADLVRRFVELRALNGCALVDEQGVAGYGYFVVEEHKGLIGDLYMRRKRQTAEHEYRLLERLLESLIVSAGVRRIESQLMMLRGGHVQPAPYPRYLSTYARNFMMLEISRGLPGSPRRAPHRRTRIERWSEQFQEPAAHLIASAYTGHVDSLINDQYRSVNGARRFLFNIVQYPGCGVFLKSASFAALEMEEHRMSGLSLASRVGPSCGHITQICVDPSARGTGLGYLLLQHSLKALAEAGCTRVSLTVTASNREAVRLYENVGFETIRRFTAYVWEGF